MKPERRLGQRHKEPVVGFKAYVATPAYDGKVDTDYAIALAESCLVAGSMGVGVTASVMGNGAFIELSRNIFVKMFLETDCTHLFFIDSDLKWEARAFVGLVKADKPVCAGMYRKRQEPEEYPVRYYETEEKPGLSIIDGGWIECDRVPTGFLCIRRDVIEEMVKDAKYMNIQGVGLVPELFYTQTLPVQDTNEYAFMGEDFSWCGDYCAKYQTTIPVWPDFDFVHGKFKCNWHEFLNTQIEKYEAKEAANG